MKRKIVLGLLAVACASTLTLGLAACGDEGNQTGNGNYTPPNYTPPEAESNELLKFKLNRDESGYTVTGLAEGVTEANIKIPATYNNLPVTSIGERAFGSCRNLTSVTISPGVSVIESGAFTDCINIPSFKFPESITVIGDSAFQNCSGLRVLNFIGTSKLEKISSNAFQNCTNLLSIDIPASVVTVGDRVFQSCSSLKSVNIGNGVKTIGVETFRGCENLENVTMGNSLKEIGERAFLSCTKISEMRFPNSLERVGLGALQDCTGIKKLTIPFVGSEKYSEPVPEEEQYSENNHTNFGYIFGAEWFDDNYKITLDNLETVVITGDSPIGYHAFQSMGRFTNASETAGIGLSSIIITGNVKVIGTGAFQGCYNLKTLVIPKSVTDIGSQILELSVKVYYGGTADDWNSNLSGVNSYNNPILLGSQRYYYSVAQPTESGSYWYYVDGVPTAW